MFFGLALQLMKSYSCRHSLIVFFLRGLIVLLKVNVRRAEQDVERAISAALD